MPHPPALPLSRWFLGLAAVTWCLIAFGALVRAQQAGLACPDWPLCYGALVPNLKLEGVIYEWGHRALAGAVAILYCLGAWRVWRDATLRPIMGKWLLGIGLLLLAQIVMGGVTVLVRYEEHGAPRPATWTVVTHLILGNAFGALALLTGLRLRRWGQGEPRSPAAVPSRAAYGLLVAWTVALAVQFLLGGNIAGNIAGLICTEFPTCNGGVWFPSFEGFVGQQVFHRLNAYLLCVLGIGLLVTLRGHARLAKLAQLLAVLLVLQIVAGAVNVFSYLHVAVTTAHSALAAALFSLTAVLWWSWRPRRTPTSP